MERKYQILILDDDKQIRDLLQNVLSPDFFFFQAEDGLNALKIMQSIHVDLVLVDMMMPEGMSGVDFITEARKRFPDTAYIIISGNQDIQSTIDAFHSGIYDYIQKPIMDFTKLKKTVRSALEKRDLILENRNYKNHLEELVKKRTSELEERNKELQDSRSRLVGILSRAAEFKDYETGQHFIRVSKYSMVLARAAGMDEDFVRLIQMASPLHDIGKIGIPESVLLKKGKLTREEYQEMQQHTAYGGEILTSQFTDSLILGLAFTEKRQPLTDRLLECAVNIAKFHHEKYDGTGYPYRLQGEEIPIEARIVSVADVFDALGSSRPYKPAWSNTASFTYLKDQKGRQFDPNLVDIFLDSRESILEIKERFQDEEEAYYLKERVASA